MSILPSNHEAVFAAFAEYLKNARLAFADFEPTRDSTDAIDSYFRGLPRRPEVNELKAVGQARDQSLAVFWRPALRTDITPVVAWMSSDGIPNGVVAKSMADFLTLLPYGVGLIIAVLDAQLDHREDPARFPDAQTKIGPEMVQYYWEKAQADKEAEVDGRAKYLAWLDETFGLQVAPAPVALIVDALENSPNFDEWLASFE